MPTKQLPIKSGPHGVSRASGGITPKIVGGHGHRLGQRHPAAGRSRRRRVNCHDRVPGVYTRLSERGVGNFLLSVTGGDR
ncbi:MAG: hypothetical protein ACJ75M_23255 [Actinomycetes bacterium]